MKKIMMIVIISIISIEATDKPQYDTLDILLYDSQVKPTMTDSCSLVCAKKFLGSAVAISGLITGIITIASGWHQWQTNHTLNVSVSIGLMTTGFCFLKLSK